MVVRRLKDDELQHHGIKGQRWGVRRYQNADGTLTDLGRKRLGREIRKMTVPEKASNKQTVKVLKGRDEIARKTGLDSIAKNAKRVSQYDDMTSTLRDITKEFHDKSSRQNIIESDEKLDKRIRKIDPNLSLEALDLSYVQIGLLKKGINPNRFATEYKTACVNQVKEYEKETKRILGDLGDIPMGSNSNAGNAAQIIAGKNFFKEFNENGYDTLYDPEFIKSPYESDDALFEKIIKK